MDVSSGEQEAELRPRRTVKKEVLSNEAAVKGKIESTAGNNQLVLISEKKESKTMT